VLCFDKAGKILEKMNVKIKNEIKEWIQLIGWMFFIMSFIYIIIMKTCSQNF